MNIAYISAILALAGSVIGGLTSGFTTWLSPRAQAKAGQLAHTLSRREDLYRDFIVVASGAFCEATMSNDPQIGELIALYAMISRMRVMCLPRTVACADKVIEATLSAYLAPNKTIADLHAMVKSGAGIDPLKEFADAAREELLAFFVPIEAMAPAYHLA